MNGAGNKSKITARVEVGAIFLVALLAALIFHTRSIEFVSNFVARYDLWAIDEFVIAYVVVSGGCFLLLLRRARQLTREMIRREQSEERAVKLARHDPLTGLVNRRVLEQDLQASLVKIEGTASECAVFVIDLDRFKPINDTHGHAVGDAVLIAVAKRLKAVVHGNGTVARMGGDEFACVIPYVSGDDLPARIATQIVREMSEPVQVGVTRVETSASIGIARAPRDGLIAGELLHGADLAMYEGKGEKRGSYRFFHAEMDHKVRERTTLESELRCAVAKGDIVPHFQPVIDLVENRIIGFEALARWPHPTRGLVPPDTFIPLAEDIGVIHEITFAMLRRACTAAREWPGEVWLAVNISPLQLKDSWLASRLLGILSETGFPGRRLVVEVTENAVIEDTLAARDIFTSLQNAGVRIALDDFGKGYSSLHHLRELNFDHLKIDQSFIHSMDSPDSAKIVSAVTGLGKSMGMPVTAEGVETLAEAEALRELGCDHAQGYLFGKAIDAAATLALLRDFAEAGALKRSA